MSADEILRALHKYAKNAQENFEVDTMRDFDSAADLIEQLNDFEHSQCAKLLARIAELEAQLARREYELQAYQNTIVPDLRAQLADARNELCQRCGRYHEAHKGACDGCRWKEMPR